MPPERYFLNWQQPALQQAAALLTAAAPHRHFIDLQNTVVLLPGARAQRRLLENLLLAAEKAEKVLIPPRQLTIGGLTDILLPPPEQEASPLQRLFAWGQALDALAPEQRELLGRDSKAFMGRLALAQHLDKLHLELASQALSFSAVATACRRLPLFTDEERWDLLTQMQTHYEELLAAAALTDRAKRLAAAGDTTAISCGRRIVLIAAPDLPPVIRQLLARCHDPISIFIHAPADLAAAFDEWGCLNMEYWNKAEVTLRDEQIQVLPDTGAEAAALMCRLGEWSTKYTGAEVSIGLCDPSAAPVLERALDQYQLSYHSSVGDSAAQAPPLLLIEAALRFISSRSFFDLGTLIRHPDFARSLSAQLPAGTDPAALLDDYHSHCLPDQIQTPLPGPAAKTTAVSRIVATVASLLGDLSAKPLPLATWSTHLRDFLLRHYDGTEGASSNKDDPADPNGAQLPLEALQALRSVLQEFYDLNGQPEFLNPMLTPAEAGQLLRQRLQGTELPPPPQSAAIELLGWLELPLDEAPALIVTGFNEGLVPQSIVGDPFLPEALRQALGLPNNDSRRARDAYFLAVLAAGRTDLCLLAPRVSLNGEQLLPSRLLFGPGDAAARVLRFFAAGPTYLPTEEAEGPGLGIPKPEPLAEPPNQISVTGLKDYLACPYRFYLRHILRLRSRDDLSPELDALNFGQLAHAVLQAFGESSVASSTKESLIRAFLQDTLDQIARQRFGARPLSSVLLQQQQLAQRLRAFAAWQAEWRCAGWEIQICEYSVPPGMVWLECPSGSISLHGRIDRIDRHCRSGAWAVLDYKTGEKPANPQSSHCGRSGWKDLQLPAYEYLLRRQGWEGPLQLGYVAVAAESAAVQAYLADWTPADLAEAQACLYQVAEAVRRQVFWPPAAGWAYSDEFAALCGVGQLGIGAEDAL